MNYDRQGTKQTFFWSHIHITLLHIRAQGNDRIEMVSIVYRHSPFCPFCSYDIMMIIDDIERNDRLSSYC